MFCKSTADTDNFSKCFTWDAPLKSQIEEWRGVLNSHCKKSFKKIWIRKKKVKPISRSIEKLINELNRILNNPESMKNKNMWDSIDTEIAKKKAIAN